jgi:hypothetical protein
MVGRVEGFVVPILVTQVGAESRVARVVNIMQDYSSAARPREIGMPAVLA